MKRWNMESWGSEYPPENWEEIADMANELIDAYAESHGEEAADDYSEELWDLYCMGGEEALASKVVNSNGENPTM